MLTQKEIKRKEFLARDVDNNRSIEYSFGFKNHKYMANGDSDTSSKFSVLQIIGAAETTVTVTYTSVSDSGLSSTFTSQELYVGDVVYGVNINNVSISAGDARIRAYYA